MANEKLQSGAEYSIEKSNGESHVGKIPQLPG
jgi:hypothetical protein